MYGTSAVHAIPPIDRFDRDVAPGRTSAPENDALHSPRGLVREIPDGREDVPGRRPDSLTRLGRRVVGPGGGGGGPTRTRRFSFRGPEQSSRDLMEKMRWHTIVYGTLHKNLSRRHRTCRRVT